MEAERLGVRVLYGQLDCQNGIYYDELKMIILDYGLGDLQAEFTLAHELGHARFGHADSSPANELKADEYAAKLLVDDAEYRRAEMLGDSPAFIAQELHLNLRTIEAYQRVMSRVRK